MRVGFPERVRVVLRSVKGELTKHVYICVCVCTRYVRVCTFLCVFAHVLVCVCEEGCKRAVSLCQGPVAASSLMEMKSQSRGNDESKGAWCVVGSRLKG